MFWKNTKLKKAEETETSEKGVKKFTKNALIYALITVAVVFGMPRALSAALGTPFPMAAITSGSMWPELKTGSLVFIKGIDGRQAQVGDIVVFTNDNGTFTIHRVIELGETSLTTKGDANFTEDESISYDSVIGRTVTVFDKPLSIPHIGSVTVFAGNFRQ